jgi:hypothetical protein
MMKQSASPFALLACATFLFLAAKAVAVQVDIAGPAGSGQFGTSVTILPNGNFVVTDPSYDARVRSRMLAESIYITARRSP